MNKKIVLKMKPQALHLLKFPMLIVKYVVVDDWHIVFLGSVTTVCQ